MHTRNMEGTDYDHENHQIPLDDTQQGTLSPHTSSLPPLSSTQQSTASSTDPFMTEPMMPGIDMDALEEVLAVENLDVEAPSVFQIDFMEFPLNLRLPAPSDPFPEINDAVPSLMLPAARFVPTKRVTVVSRGLPLSLVLDEKPTEAKKLAETEQTRVQSTSEREPDITQEDISVSKKEQPTHLEKLYRRERCIAMSIVIVNVLLLGMKAVAVQMSGSLSIISSLVDSCVDITAGLVIWITAIVVKRTDPDLYPRGRHRLEPFALMLVSVIRMVASTQVIISAAEGLVEGTANPNIDSATLIIMFLTIAIKFIMAVICFVNRDIPTVLFMGQDNRNDCVGNSIGIIEHIPAILCAFIGQEYWKYMDSIGAILVSLYMAITWCIFGYTTAVMLSGRAKHEGSSINGIVKLCSEHDDRILSLDTVFVYHWSTKYIVEVHLVFPKNMTVETAYQIAQPLKEKIENLSYVERAFIHIDYEMCCTSNKKNAA